MNNSELNQNKKASKQMNSVNPTYKMHALMEPSPLKGLPPDPSPAKSNESSAIEEMANIPGISSLN